MLKTGLVLLSLLSSDLALLEERSVEIDGGQISTLVV